MKVLDATPAAVAEATEALRRGELVAFPTETVYGLGADARNPEAVRKIFTAKGRPADHPLIVHLPDAAYLPDWAEAVPAVALELAERFWPGPLTLILRRSSRVPDEVTGAQDTVGLRVPGHPVALELLRAFAGGVAAPSANRFGRISPTRAAHVAEELGERVSLILDGGESEVGLESSILDLTGARARLLRPGGVAPAALAAVLGYAPEVVTRAGMRVSGALASHYAPRTPAVLVERVDGPELRASAAVLSRRARPAGFGGVWLELPPTPEAYAQRLYAALRELDALGLEGLYIEAVPEDEAWLAVRDRLRRATAASRQRPEEVA